MPAGMLRTMMVVAVCLFDGAFAVAWGRPRCASASPQRWVDACRSVETRKAPLRSPGSKQKAAPTLAADRDPYADPAAPYKANRLSSRSAEPILNIPGQTTVLTRQVLDDMKATSLTDAMRSTAGVTVGR